MGIILAFIAVVFGAAKDTVSKHLSFSLDGTASAFASFAFALPFYIILLFVCYLFGFEEPTLPRAFVLFVIARAVTDTVAESLKMHAFSSADISFVAPFIGLAPLFLIFISPVITGDQITPGGVLGIALAVVGGLYLAYEPRPAGVAFPLRGIMLALGAAFFFALNNCFDRLAVLEGGPVLAGFGMTLLSALLLLPFGLASAKRREALQDHRTPLLLRGLMEVLFMVTKLAALQYLQAPYVSGIQKLTAVISILSGRFLFGEAQTGRRMTAAGIIICGVLVILYAAQE